MYEYRAEAIRVIDADTIEMRIDLGFFVHIVEKVRVLNYDAPETKLYSGVTEEEKKQGLLAAVKAEELLFVDEERTISEYLIVRTHRKLKGKYGRFLAEILIRDGVDEHENILYTNYADHMKELGFVKNG